MCSNLLNVFSYIYFSNFLEKVFPLFCLSFLKIYYTLCFTWLNLWILYQLQVTLLNEEQSWLGCSCSFMLEALEGSNVLWNCYLG